MKQKKIKSRNDCLALKKAHHDNSQSRRKIHLKTPSEGDKQIKICVYDCCSESTYLPFVDFSKHLNYLDRRWKAGSKISMQKQFYLTNMELIFGKRFWEQFEVLIDSFTKSISFKFIIAFVLMLSDYSTIFCG